jgi:MFS-type transporter involved in bile tolerance (Atg22 family)
MTKHIIMPLRRDQLAWLGYDFANSILLVTGGLLFVKWFTLDLGGSAELAVLVFSASAVACLVLLPSIAKTVSHAADVAPIFRITTILLAVLAFALGGLGIVGDAGAIIRALALGVFFLSLVTYQVTLSIHNAVLARGFPENEHTRLSGMGAAANWIGSVIGVVVATLSVGLGKTFEIGRPVAFMCSGFIFCVIAMLCIRSLSYAGRLLSGANGTASAAPRNSLDYASLFKSVAANRGKLVLFVGYVLFIDAAITIQNNLPLFFSQSIGLDDNAQAPFFLIILVFAAIGGIAFARNGHAANRELQDIVVHILFFSVAALVVASRPNTGLLAIACGAAGYSIGYLEGAFRANWISRSRPGSYGSDLSVFSIFQRLASVTGPILWSGTLLITGDAVRGASFAICILSITALLGAELLYWQGASEQRKVEKPPIDN